MTSPKYTKEQSNAKIYQILAKEEGGGNEICFNEDKQKEAYSPHIWTIFILI